MEARMQNEFLLYSYQANQYWNQVIRHLYKRKRSRGRVPKLHGLASEDRQVTMRYQRTNTIRTRAGNAITVLRNMLGFLQFFDTSIFLCELTIVLQFDHFQAWFEVLQLIVQLLLKYRRTFLLLGQLLFPLMLELCYLDLLLDNCVLSTSLKNFDRALQVLDAAQPRSRLPCRPSCRPSCHPSCRPS